MNSFKEKLEDIEKKSFHLIIWIFYIGFTFFTILSYFFSTLNEYKVDFQVFIAVTGITIILAYLKSLNTNMKRINTEKILIFRSKTPNHSEIENRLHKYKKVEILILANSMTTMWNTLLKHFLDRVDKGDQSAKVDVKIIKRLNSKYIKLPNQDPVIASIQTWFEEKKSKSKISIEIVPVLNKIYFTGICLNKEYLRTRFINPSENREIIRISYKNLSENDDVEIEWFKNTFDDIWVNGLTKITLEDKK